MTTGRYIDRAILRVVGGGARFEDIRLACESYEVTERTLHRHVRRLVEAGAVVARGVTTKRIYDRAA